MKKPKVYIAAPLFNAPQLQNLARIEDHLDRAGFSYFSPRLETEGLLPEKSQRRDPKAWYPMFNKNLYGINECHILLAVMNYPLPPNVQMGLALGIVHSFEHHDQMAEFKPLSLPDNGAVWEMGYAYANNKLIVGFNPEGGDHLNMMLTSCCDATISSWETFTYFFPVGEYAAVAPPSCVGRSKTMDGPGMQNYLVAASCLNFGVADSWGAQVEDA